MTDATAIPLRSFLFTPANHPRRVEKVFEVGADAVILDLEDAVAVSEKAAARNALWTRSVRDPTAALSIT
jgi:citrate lyase beta subunit